MKRPKRREALDELDEWYEDQCIREQFQLAATVVLTAAALLLLVTATVSSTSVYTARYAGVVSLALFPVAGLVALTPYPYLAWKRHRFKESLPDEDWNS